VIDATIRRATPEDARAIAEVHVASWRWAYRGQLPDDVLAALSADGREAQWVDQLSVDEADVLVAERAGAVVGFASAMGSRDDDAAASTGEVLTVYVTREAAGTGTGRALLRAAEDALRTRGFTRATLWVLTSNDRARSFYERNGWAWDGATSDHQIECANHPIVRYVTSL
jgi:ribosomal protein S18 acetylase RimI-like enzyme